MKIFLPTLALLPLLALQSCSSVEQQLAEARQMAFGDPKLRVTKADPKRFLPEGTTVEQVVARNEIQTKKAATKSKAAPKPTRLLAKNTKTQPKKRSTSVAQTQAKAKPKPQPKPEPIPPLELPPLPEHMENDNQEFKGILPSLDGSDIATYVDVDGETPEMLPFDFIEEEPAPAAE